MVKVSMGRLVSKLGEFEKSSILLMACSLLAGVFNYTFQIYLGNVSTVTDYGMINILLTEISMISIINAPIGLYASRNIAVRGGGRSEEMDRLLAVIWEITAIFCLFTVLSLYALYRLGFMNTALSGRQIAYFILCAITNVLYSILLYIAQGYKDYKSYSFVSLLYTVIKFGVAIMLYSRSNGIVEFLQAVLITNLICIVMLLYTNRSRLWKKYRLQKLSDSFYSLAYFYGWTFVIQIIIGFLMSGGDIVWVDVMFSEEQAGIYSVAATLSKAALFCSTPITTIMFPEVAGQTDNREGNLRLLKKTLIYGGGIAGAYLVLLNILGGQVVGILYGERYAGAVVMIPAASLYVMAVIVLNIICQYCIAVEKVRKLTIGMIVLFGTVYVFCMQIATLVHMVVFCGGAVLLFALCFLVYIFRDGRAN